MIRRATARDLPAIVALCVRFNETPAYRDLLQSSPERITTIGENMLATDDALLLVSVNDADHPVGLLAMTIYEHPFTGERLASELVWWINPEDRGGTAGVRLLKHAEAWAASRGVRRVQMIAPDERVGRFYEALGYELTERIYLRKVS